MTVFSTFNPSSVSPEVLESTFVQRASLADRLVGIFEESALTESKHNVLLVGPRGIGKSHLVSLVYHRLRSRKTLADKLAIAYLREDEWGINTFLDLLLRILRELATEPDMESRETNAQRAHADDVKSETDASGALRKILGNRTLLVIVENLDSIFEKIGEQGQREWRALMQTYPNWAVLATTPALFSAISRQVSPFYGFFEVIQLQGLSTDDAVCLLKSLARYNKDESTASFLDTAVGRARVRAVQHLAGGNHRIFVLFYEFLSQGGSDHFVAPLIKTVDALTPYYQAQMARLSAQQQKIVNFLCEHQRPATVTAIASYCRTTHQTAASQLKQLLGHRYVRVDRVGRESFYELTEPLLRICVEAKSHHGQPLDLLVDFIRYWFSREELERKLPNMDDLGKAYFSAALKEYDAHAAHPHLSPEIASLCVSLSQLAGTPARLREWATELVELSKIAEDWDHYARAMAWLQRGNEAIPVLEEVLKKQPNDVSILRSLTGLYAGIGSIKHASELIEKAIEIDPERGVLFFDKGLLLAREQRNDEAIAAFEKAVNADATLGPVVSVQKARVLLDGNETEKARRAVLPFASKGELVPGVFLYCGLTYMREQEFKRALTYLDKAVQAFPYDPSGWGNRGIALCYVHRYEDAYKDLEQALQLDPKAEKFLSHYRCEALLGSKNYELAVKTTTPEILSHAIFHLLLDLANSHPKQGKLQQRLVALKRAHQSQIWQDAFRGGLTQFASGCSELASPEELEDLGIWNGALHELFASLPEFSIIVKLFDVLTRIKLFNDRKALLELPREQRLLLLGDKEELDFINQGAKSA